jgi:hypothetical protein
MVPESNRPHPSLIAVAICTPHPQISSQGASPMRFAETNIVQITLVGQQPMRTTLRGATTTGQNSRWDLQGTGK